MVMVVMMTVRDGSLSSVAMLLVTMLAADLQLKSSVADSVLAQLLSNLFLDAVGVCLGHHVHGG